MIKRSLTVILCVSNVSYAPNRLIILTLILIVKSVFLPAGNFVFNKYGLSGVVGFKIVALFG